MRRTALLLALGLVATTCSPAVTDQRTLEPTPTVAPPTISVSTPTLTPSASPLTTSATSPTPVPRKMMGRATLKTTGAGVAGAPGPRSAMPLNHRGVPGPAATAVTAGRGGYTPTGPVWSGEALASSGS